MAERRIDWGSTNQLLKQFQSFMMQDMLGQKRSERSLDYLRQQMSEYERLDVLQNEMRKEVAGEQNRANIELAILSAKLKAAADPTADEDKIQAQILEATGRPEEAAARRARHEQRLLKISEVEAERFKDEDSPAKEELLTLLSELGIKEAGDYFKEGAARRRAKEERVLSREELEEKTAGRIATGERAAEQRKISQQTADTAAEKLAFERRKEGIEMLEGAKAFGKEGKKIRGKEPIPELPIEEEIEPALPQQIEEPPLTPMEKRQIYVEALIENGVTPDKAERMARRKYGL